MQRILVASVCTFLNVPALMTVAPVVAQTASGQAADGGLVTALFSGATVGAELLMPTLMGRYRPGRLLSIALLLIGFGAIAHLVLGPGLPGMLGLAVVRGLGFGTAVVAAAVLVAELAPSGAHGRAIGNLGLVIGVASMVSPSLGLLLLNRFSAELVFGLAGVVALLGVLSVDGVDRGRPRPITRPLQVAEGLKRRGLVVPVLGLALLTMTYGALVSFGPRILEPVGWGSAASFFFVYGAARASARWLGGRAADRLGPRLVIVWGTALTSLGLVLLAVNVQAALVVAAAGLAYGAGAGMAQSGAFVGMLARVQRAEVPLVGTMWNMAFDGGVSLGGAVLGLVVALSGTPTAMLWSLPLLSVLALLLFATDRGELRTG